MAAPKIKRLWRNRKLFKKLSENYGEYPERSLPVVLTVPPSKPWVFDKKKQFLEPLDFFP